MISTTIITGHITVKCVIYPSGHSVVWKFTRQKNTNQQRNRTLNKDIITDRAVEEQKWWAQQKGTDPRFDVKKKTSKTCTNSSISGHYSPLTQRWHTTMLWHSAAHRHCNEEMRSSPTRVRFPEHWSPDWNSGRCVCTLITYVCESWTLTEEVCRKLNGADSLMLLRVTTSNPIRQEAHAATTSHDWVHHIRVMCLKWITEILTGDQNCLIFCDAYTQCQMGSPGNLFLDASPRHNFEVLVSKGTDKAQDYMHETITWGWSDSTRFIIYVFARVVNLICSSYLKKSSK